MNIELTKALQAVLLQHGITPTVANPIGMSIISEKKDTNLQLTLPLVEKEELLSLRSVEVSDLNLKPVNRNALIRNNFTTVGSILDHVESNGYLGLLRINGLGERGFQALREKLWDIGLVLDDKWKIGNLRDVRRWEEYFDARSTQTNQLSQIDS